MSEARDAKIRAAIYVTFGALWIALCGACAWNIADTAGPYRGFWPFGLWFTSLGVPLLAIGLRSFMPRRVLGWGLCAIGAAWLGLGLKFLADFVLDAAKNGVYGAGVAIFLVLWLIFQVPGAAMLWGGVAILKAKPEGGAG